MPAPRFQIPFRFLVPVVFWAVYGGPAMGVELQPHRAIYSIELLEARSDNHLSPGDVGGSMVIGVEKACDAWLQVQQVVLEIGPSGSPLVKIETTATNRESLDGLSYKFATVVQTTSQGAAAEKDFGLEGAAVLEAAGGPGRTERSLPDRRTGVLPEGSVFPLEQMRRLIDAALAGKTFDTQIVFDGIATEDARQENTFIGTRREADPQVVEAFGPIVAHPSWPIRVAMFPLTEKGSGEPIAEVEGTLLDNGIASRLVLEQGPLKLLMTLKAVEASPEPECSGN